MVLNSAGQVDAAKTNLYRDELGQAPISAANNKFDSPANFCQNMLNIQTPFLAANQTLLATGQSPVTAVGDNLLTFLANRLSMSFTNLSCQNFGLTDPVTVTLDGNGAATAATFNTAQQGATSTGQTSAGGAGLVPGTPSRGPSPSPDDGPVGDVANPSGARDSLARRHQAGLVGEHHGLGAVAQGQLHEDAAHVGLGGLLGDHQMLADLRVRQAAGDERQHLRLARGELAQRRRPARPAGGGLRA